ncbi:hypothetical protein QKW45_19570 [Streptomyces sp. AJ-1]|uniref:hypothetical protein n=1 Tax=Streptomyces sp. AJ-1 TaxID=3044384 RepID=UPI00249AD6DF|nr:hypothetical protein [Streptomyces sp. AJ-1]MDI3345932.1 hypothetical protein [Streptomyces sp. AJ-1]
MTGAEPWGPLAAAISGVAIHLGIADKSGEVYADPEEISDEYIAEISVQTRAFLVLCSSELEEYVEARCLAFLGECVSGADERLQHNCLHALSIHFRSSIGKLLDGGGYYVDFYSTPKQVRRYGKDNDAVRKKSVSVSSENEEPAAPPILNRLTLTAKLCAWYRDHVVASSHGISDGDLVALLTPLGFSANLVKESCGTLCAALQSLAAARGEAAHRSANSGGWPFSALPTALSQQLSLRDTWDRWQAVLNSLHEFEDLLMGTREGEGAASA